MRSAGSDFWTDGTGIDIIHIQVPPGVRWSLQVCRYCLRDLRGKRQLTDASCILKQSLPVPLLSKVAKLVGAFVGRTG